ncbi:ankyrin repeat domain-containing protein 26-like [Phacochoerus africanus]|uniref:ankyrin repeat domain-containing protein 26-like n=1 Tax=Phacochoerus africanus TaxID=41426 RepID=UPI001FD94E4E|nr:ankyrin repeat domain-containing protein 26-like [Phacochoerus africanus]
MCYFSGVCYIPSCTRGPRNIQVAEVECPRDGDIRGTPMDSPEKYPRLTPTIENVKDSVPNKTVGTRDLQTSRSECSAWDATGLTRNNKTCPRARPLKMDDNSPVGSQSVTTNQSSSRECGPMALIDTEKVHAGAKKKKYMLHDLCEPQLPENQESRKDSPEKYPHLKSPVVVKKSVPHKTVGTKALRMSRAECSAWDATGLARSNETCPRAGPLKMDDNSPVGSQSVTRNQSSSRECGPMALADEENPHVGTKGAKSKKHRLRGPCVSPLPQNQESKEDSVSLLKNQDSVLSDDRLVELKKGAMNCLQEK